VGSGVADGVVDGSGSGELGGVVGAGIVGSGVGSGVVGAGIGTGSELAVEVTTGAGADATMAGQVRVTRAAA